MPREPLHKIYMRSKQWFIRYRAHNLLGWLFFSKCPPSAILFLMDSSQKLIRSSERNIQRATTSNLNEIQPTIHKLSRSQALWAAISSSDSHLVFHEFFPKVNQIIRNTQRTTTSNWNVIQPTGHEISRPQAFWAAIFSKCPSQPSYF